MPYMIMRVGYSIYFLGSLLLLTTLVARILFGNVPEGLPKNRARYFVEGLVFALIWPIALLTKNGRVLFRKHLPK